MSESQVNLHLGCGERNLPYFIHIDLDVYPHIDYQRDIRDLSIFEDNTVDLIYCSHSLEYFDRFEVKSVLREWNRVLRPGGTLRLAVPDFENMVKVYLKYDDLDHQGILGPLYGRWPYKSTEDKIDAFYHKTTYDFKSLEKVLLEAKFNDVKRYDWQKTIHKDHDDHSQAYIPHMDKENGILISLNVEAKK